MPEGNGGVAAPTAGAGVRQAKLEGASHIVAVASAKGGVGKSTVAANLAVALRALGHRVGYADVDIYGPSAPIMFGVTELPRPDEQTRLILPVVAHGIAVMSMGFFVDDNAPVVWRGPMAMSATKQFLRGVAWGELDYLIVDLPPGTGDIPLTLAQEVPLDGAVIVTTPQDVALADVRRGVAMFRKLNTPILGIVDNMAGFICPDCGTRDDLFGSLRPQDLMAMLGAPILAEIPIVERVRESGDGGRPLVAADPDHPVSKIFLQLALGVIDSLATARAGLAGPEPSEIVHDAAASRLRIRWTDGQTTSYTLRGLRGWCPCAQCQGHAGQTRFVNVDDAKLTSFEGVGRYAVRFLWEDGHSTGMYSYSYLREIADYPECAA